MATAVRHQEISDQFIEHAEDEFRKGDLLQASEKIWGALAHCVKAIARRRGWRNESHQDIRRNAYELIDLTDAPRQNALLFKAIELLHVNFYEDTYADRPQEVERGIEDARELIGAMKIAETRLPDELSRVFQVEIEAALTLSSGGPTLTSVLGLEPFEIDEVVDRALAEDLASGDPTTDALIPCGRTGRAVVVPKGEGILAGGAAAVAAWKRLDPEIQILSILPDGLKLHPHDPSSGVEGDVIAEIEGGTAAILKGERTAINLLQHMSGIATETARLVEAAAGFPARIVDTRKTLPGLRALQKYAVRVGGGGNHRRNLGDGVLIKDNHLAALGRDGLGISDAVRLTRARAPHTLKIEVEVETVEQVEEALAAGADVLLLDNMAIPQMAEAVALAAGRAVTEASGNITLDNARQVAATGVDLISVGRLTHSPRALDISLDLVW